MTEQFEPIALNDLERVKLLNRYDTKYWFNQALLEQILHEVESDYYILRIDGESLLPYATSYFDTPQATMYTNHHNGRKTRCKIRKRTYVNSNIQFLELKHKTNKGKTLKTRIQTTNPFLQFDETERHFIDEFSPYQSSDLDITLYNEFNRITLVNKNFEERCTIDTNLVFRSQENRICMNEMVIAEIKSERGSKASPLKIALRNSRIKPKGFSKYCVGSALVRAELKQNRFKSKIRNISKVLPKASSSTKTA